MGRDKIKQKLSLRGLGGYLLKVFWWDHTYGVDDEVAPDLLWTYGVFNKVKTVKGRKYMLLFPEGSTTDTDYKRHHFTILVDEIHEIRKVEKHNPKEGADEKV